MNDAILVALLSLAGTLVGSLGGVLTANRLTNYRIAELEKKVEKHNSIVERTAKVEQRSASNTHRIDELCDRMNERRE